MAAFLFEVEGLTLVVNILKSIVDDTDKDSPVSNRSKELLEIVNEMLENYIGIENDFSTSELKDLYYEYIIDILDQVIGRGAFNDFLNLKNIKIKNVQLCEQNDDAVLLHIGECDGCS